MLLVVVCMTLRQQGLWGAQIVSVPSDSVETSLAENYGTVVTAGPDNMSRIKGRPVIVFSRLPLSVSRQIVRGIADEVGEALIELNIEKCNSSVIRKIINSFGVSRRTPRVVVSLGTSLTRKLSTLLPPGIKLVGLVSSKTELKIPAADTVDFSSPVAQGLPSLKSCGVALSYAPSRVFQVMKSIAPAVRNIGILVSSGKPLVDIPSIIATGRDLGLKVVVHRFKRQSDIASSLAALLQKVDAILLVQDKIVLKADNVRYLLGKAVRARCPVIGLSASYVKAGALFCLKHDFHDIGVQMGSKISPLLNDGLPCSVCTGYVEPKKAIVVINRRILSLLGLSIPEVFPLSASVDLVE